MTLNFNTGIDASVIPNLAGLDGVEVVRLDVYGKLLDIVGNPSPFGLTNVQAACITPQSAPYHCQEFDAYLLWDGIHPTKAAHAIIAHEATAVLIH